MTTPQIRTVTVLTSIVFSILVISGCSSGGGDAGQSTNDGPAGKLVLYTSEPQENANKIVSSFNEEYPNVDVQVFRSGTGQLLAKIDSEKEAGEVQADVIVAADAPSFEQLKEDELLATYTPKGVSKIDDRFRDPEGYYTGTRLIATIIGYNTDQVENPPQSWKSLTNSEYKGKLGMPSPDYSGAASYNTAVWSRQPSLGWEWIRNLANNNPTVVEGNGQVQQGLATGRFPVGIVIDYMTRDLEKQGSPVSGVYPKEGVPTIYEPAAIFKASDNKEAAQAFIDFLVSEKGQKLAVEQNYIPIRQGIEGPEGAPSLEEIKVMDADIKEVTRQLDSAKERFNSLVSQND